MVYIVLWLPIWLKVLLKDIQRNWNWWVWVIKLQQPGNFLDLALGYSHNIIFEIPKELNVVTSQEKGKNPMITFESMISN